MKTGCILDLFGLSEDKTRLVSIGDFWCWSKANYLVSTEFEEIHLALKNNKLKTGGEEVV